MNDGQFDNQDDGGYTIAWKRDCDHERRGEWDIYVLLSVYDDEQSGWTRRWSMMSRNAQVGLPEYRNWEHA